MQHAARASLVAGGCVHVALNTPCRSFDRTDEDLQLLAAWLVEHCSPFFSSMRQDVVQYLCKYAGEALLSSYMHCALT